MSELSNRVAQVERERDEARAELEREKKLSSTLYSAKAKTVDALNEARAEVALLRSQRDRHDEGTFKELRAEVERLRKKNAEQANLIHDLVVRDAKPAVPPIVTTATHVQIPRADYERVAHLLDGAASPAVCAVDVEAAAKEIADGFELHLGDDDTRTESLIVAILRKHTRAIGARLAENTGTGAPDVGAGLAEPEPAAPRGEWTEEQREAAWDMHLRTRGYTIDCNAARDHICLALAHVAPLFAPEPAPRPPFVVDRDRFNGIANRAGLAVARAIDECIAEIERQRAEFERGGAT